jgi:RNA polymerase sigma-70 factor (ECF subfamily)
MKTVSPTLGKREPDLMPVRAQTLDKREDVELLTAIAQSREESAFSELLARYQQDAFALAMHITANREWAEETVQEAMIRVWTSAGSYRGDGPVKAWLLRVVARESIKIIKSMRRKSSKMESQCGLDLNDAAAASPLKNAESTELSQALRGEFDRLPALDRQLVGLHFGGGLTQAEISEALSIPQQTISYRLTGVLKTLRGNLSAAGYAAVPLLTAEAYAQILRSGQDLPLGLRERVLSRLSSARASVRSRRSMRKTPQSNPTTLALSATAVLAAAGGVIWLLTAKPAALPPVSATPSAPGVVTPQIVAKDNTPAAERPMKPLGDWHRRWSFAKGVPEDIFAIHGNGGNWTYNPATQSMDIPGTINFFPTYLLPDYPLQFTFTGKALDMQKDLTQGIMMYKDNAMPEKRLWKKRHTFTRLDVVLKVWLYHSRVVAAMDGEVGYVAERDIPLENLAVVFQLDNYSIQELSCTPLTENEVPDFVKNPELIKDLQRVK